MKLLKKIENKLGSEEEMHGVADEGISGEEMTKSELIEALAMRHSLDMDDDITYDDGSAHNIQTSGLRKIWNSSR